MIRRFAQLFHFLSISFSFLFVIVKIQWTVVRFTLPFLEEISFPFVDLFLSQTVGLLLLWNHYRSDVIRKLRKVLFQSCSQQQLKSIFFILSNPNQLPIIIDWFNCKTMKIKIIQLIWNQNPFKCLIFLFESLFLVVSTGFNMFCCFAGVRSTKLRRKYKCSIPQRRQRQVHRMFRCMELIGIFFKFRMCWRPLQRKFINAFTIVTFVDRRGRQVN